MVNRLSDEERMALLAELPEWTLVAGRDAIERNFRFGDFSRAWAFMARVALLAEKHDHHPEWSNVYSHVSIVLTTHDAGGLSALDAMMAREIDKMVAQQGTGIARG